MSAVGGVADGDLVANRVAGGDRLGGYIEPRLHVADQRFGAAELAIIEAQFAGRLRGLQHLQPGFAVLHIDLQLTLGHEHAFHLLPCGIEPLAAGSHDLLQVGQRGVVGLEPLEAIGEFGAHWKR